MLIGGHQKLTLIDYPGKLATTVFTVGCPFRCSFCHNPELIEVGNVNSGFKKTEKDFFVFLKKRKGKIEGVCITGGEPTIQPDILDFMEKVKNLGYFVKLDTNGIRPDIIKSATEKGIVDFIAMDIKNSPDKYQKTVGTNTDLERIKISVDMIMNGPADYEFRTTVVPGIHTENDFDEIAKWIRGAKSYYLQKFRDVKIFDESLKEKTKNKNIDLMGIKKKIGNNFEKMGIRD